MPGSAPDGSPPTTWAQYVRGSVRVAEEPRRDLLELAAHGRTAWKAFVPLGPTVSALIIGCGSGLACYALAPHVGVLHALTMEGPTHLAARLQHQPCPANVHCAVVDAQPLLPFPSLAFDLVVVECLPPALQASAIPALFEEIGRVLSPRGSVLVIADNPLDLQRMAMSWTAPERHAGPARALWEGSTQRLRRPPAGTPHRYTLAGLRRLLRSTRAAPASEYVFDFEAGHMSGIRLPDSPKRPSRPASLKQRLRESTHLAPAFAILGSRAELPLETPVSLAVRDVTTAWQRCQGGAASILRAEVTRKEKLVLTLECDDQRAIVKFPLTRAATSSETRNHQILHTIEGVHPERELSPRPLTAGNAHGLAYFAESHLAGVPLRARLLESGRVSMLGAVFDLVDRLHPATERVPTSALDGSLYDAFVGSRLDGLLRLLDSDATSRRVSGFFEHRVRGIEVSTGLTHGDFSTSNLLVQDDGALVAIDWEGGSEAGIPILDAINYLDSVQRLFAPDQRIAQTLPRLASQPWHVREEQHFLDRCYERLNADPAHHEVFVYLRWLRHVGFLADFWLQYDDRAIRTYVHEVIENSPMAAG